MAFDEGLATRLRDMIGAEPGLSQRKMSGGLAIPLHGNMTTVSKPAVWGLGQTVTGALSDRWGRKWLIVLGMLTQAAGIGIVAAGTGFVIWAVAATLMGAGTAMVYPTLLAVIGDVAHPTWRARAVGVYRLWRDGGYAVGALVAGITADLLGIQTAIWLVAAITAASGIVVAPVCTRLIRKVLD